LPFREAAWRFAGRAGGLVAYYAGKLAMRALNARKRRRPLSEEAARRLGWLYPAFDLGRVAVIEDARLVARWVERPPRTAGMAFGRVIYLARPYSERTDEGLLLLAHELGHVRQIQTLGEAAFARRYGEEWLAYGYERMPLERDAEGCRGALRERLKAAAR
jgi:hypothetical protein